jgi:NodT family efflux transporter outer membrane factor (OMF) lipoprotein
MILERCVLRAQAAARASCAAGALALLSACTVGPDFDRPSAVTSGHFDQQAEQQLGVDASTAAPHGRASGKIEGGWWSIFGSPKLDGTVLIALEGNLDLVAADATIAQANEAVSVVRAGLRPQVDLTADAGRQRAGRATSSFYTVGPRVSFDFDLFGGTKRLVEQRVAVAEVQEHRFDAAYLTLTGDIATQAVLLASARAQLAAVEVVLTDDRRTLELVRAGHKNGGATQLDVAIATTQLAQHETLLPPLSQQRDLARHALSVLAGKAPADWTPPEFDMTDFALPPEIPLTLPSEVARNRPDILEAEAELHAATAAIGVATADLYPHVQLAGSLGAAGPGAGTLWGVAAALAGPLFHGGALQAKRRASVEGYRSALATYQQTVVRSLGQVADLLQAINHDGEEFAAQDRTLVAAETSLRLNREGYRVGELDLLRVLDAERAYQLASLGRIRARTAQHLDIVQLSVALGGNATGAFERRMAQLGKDRYAGRTSPPVKKQPRLRP